MTIPLQPQSIPNRVLSLHNPQRQCAPNAREHEGCPLPPERVDHNAEHEPVHQLRVSKEVEGSGWRMTLDGRCHVDPSFHPFLLWPGEWIDEEHEKQARIDSNVVLENLIFSPPSLGLNLRLQKRSGVGKVHLQCLRLNLRKRLNYQKLTLPTVPIALTYVQLLAGEIFGSALLSRREVERCSGTMLTADGHMLGWKDFGASVLA